MKSERRHELERNQLSVWLAETFEQVKPYTNAILVAVLAVLVLSIGVTWWNNFTASRSTGAWDEYFAALNRNDRTALETVAQKHQGSEAGHWARVTLGDMQLASGCNLLFVNKTSANLELRKAAENYQAVLAQAGTPVLLERARYGLARAREAQGDLDQALNAYREVTQRWPDGVYAQASQERIKDLNEQSTRAFYDKFAKFDPKPPLADQPGTPGKKPAFDLDALPDEPGVKFGEAKKEAPGTETKPEAKPQAQPEAKPEAKPAEEPAAKK